ncbi:MAG: fatty acid desaturase [Acidimicrobiia bacterium]|jgi:fatty acid desaturase|nr:fatty acid desaturase [Acidimicrobiia bacterium]
MTERSEGMPAARGGVARPAPPARQLAALVGADVVRDLGAKADGPGARRAAAHLALLVGGAAAVWEARGTRWIVPALVVHGCVLAHAFAALHETSHRTAFSRRRANDVGGAVAGALVWLSPTYFRHEHRAHHSTTGDPVSDPERIPAPGSWMSYVAFLVGGAYWHWNVSTTVGHAAGRFADWEGFVPDHARSQVVRESRWLVGGLATLVAVSVVTGSTALWWLWALPRLIGEPWMRAARLAEHTGLAPTGAITGSTRSLRVPRPLRWLAWEMPFHAEHHAAPSVPFHALARLHRHLGPYLMVPVAGPLVAHRAAVGAGRRAAVVAPDP